MENYSSNKDTYIKRMNQTAKSKFAVVESYLSIIEFFKNLLTQISISFSARLDNL